MDGAIHRAAGPGLRRACEGLAEVRPGVRCPAGEARITPGFDLPARHVIHTVGPVWRGGNQGEPDLLSDCYRSSLRLAEQHGVRSIAFPAISCGVYGYPPDRAARVATRTVTSFLEERPTIRRVVLVAFDEQAEASLRRAWRELAREL